MTSIDTASAFTPTEVTQPVEGRFGGYLEESNLKFRGSYPILTIKVRLLSPLFGEEVAFNLTRLHEKYLKISISGDAVQLPLWGEEKAF